MKKIFTLSIFIFIISLIFGFVATNQILNQKKMVKYYTEDKAIALNLPKNLKVFKNKFNKNSSLEIKDIDNNIYFLVIEEDKKLYPSFEKFVDFKEKEDNKKCSSLKKTQVDKRLVLSCDEKILFRNVLLAAKKYTQVIIWTDKDNTNFNFDDIIKNIEVIDEKGN